MKLEEIRELVALFEGASLTELKYRVGDDELSLKKEAAAAAPRTASSRPGARPAPPPPAPADKSGSSPAPAEGLELIAAPLVGAFYRAPSLDSEPFVQEGQSVEKGQSLCILEAMKVMHQFEAEFACVVVRIIPANGALVEYGSPLFEVRRL